MISSDHPFRSLRRALALTSAMLASAIAAPAVAVAERAPLDGIEAIRLNPVPPSGGSVAYNGDGRFEVLTPAPDGTVYTVFQHEIGQGWSAPSPFPHPPGSRTTHQVVVATNDDGRLEAAWLGEDGRGHITRQRPGRDGWTAIAPLEPADVHLASPPTFGRNMDGRLELFAVRVDGALIHAFQHTPGGEWSSWYVLDPAHAYSTDIAGAVTVGLDPFGSLHLVARASDGRLWHTWQDAVWTPPEDLSTLAAGRPMLRLNNGLGGMGSVIYYRAGDGRLHVANPSPFTGDFVLDDSVEVASAASAFTNTDLRQEVFVAGADDVLYHSFQWPTAYYPLSSLVSTGMPCSQTPTLLRNLDGRLEVFCVGPDGTLWHDFQNVPGGGWFGPTALQGTYATGP